VKRFFLIAAAAILLVGAGAAALVAWLTADPPGAASPEAAASRSDPPPAPVLLPLPQEPAARDRALEENEGRQLFHGLRLGFDSGERSPRSEARLLPALDVLFPKGEPRWRLECRRLVCRLEVDAPASEWRQAFAENHLARQQVERAAFDPDGAGLAFVELVEDKAAAGPARPEGEKILDELAKALLESEAARACVAEGPAPGGAEVRLMIDRSGITYRFGAAVDSRVATCLMMQAMPDVVGGASAPANVRRAERKVVVRAGP
jgi:hypothetical protein